MTIYFKNEAILLKRISLVYLNNSHLQARWNLNILGKMALILLIKNKEKAIKNTITKYLECTAYTNMRHSDMCKKFYKVQEGEREVKNFPEVFGWLFIVIKDNSILHKLK